MHRIDGAGATVDNKFTEGDPVGGVQATVVTAEWLNDIQENLMELLTVAGIAPVKGNSSQVLSAVKGRLLNIQVITASGTVTKTPGATKWRVRQIGGGGQGGGTQATASSQVAAGGGGSSGSYADALFDVSAIATAVATIGAGGASAANGANGANGGSTTLIMGSYSLTTPGGPGGSVGAAQSSLPNEGGSAAAFAAAPSHVGALSFLGVPGGGATTALLLSPASAQPGIGGSSVFGNSRGPAGSAVGYGAGGAGGRSLINTAANNGPQGAQGVIIIEEYA